MKKRSIIFISIVTLLLLTFSIFAVGCKPKKEPEKEEETVVLEKDSLAARADQLAKATINLYIDKDIYENDKEIYMYGYYIPEDEDVDGEASVWHYTSVLAMTNRMRSIVKAEENKKFYDEYNNAILKDLDFYKGTGKVVSYQSNQNRTMYAVKRANTKGKADISGVKAVYDDQMWIIRELISAYNNTNNEQYLKEAESLTATCLDGWDDTINPATGIEYGGITWGPGYNSKHTCSNAPLITPLLDLYEIYKSKDATKANAYKEWAIKIYDFCYSIFRKSNDLYGDLVGTEGYIGKDGTKITTFQGTLDISEYTYNAGTMIQAGAKLYKVTNNKAYLTQAQNTADSAHRNFSKVDPKSNKREYVTTSTAWFNFEMLLGFVDLAKVDNSAYKENSYGYVNSFRDSLNYAYDNYYYNGLLPRNFIHGWMTGVSYDSKKDVMDAAACAEMYALLSQYYNS